MDEVKLIDRAKRLFKARDAPKGSVGWLCSPQAYNTLVGDGYIPLSACPEVQICVHKYADLMSSMTLYLLRNTENGDVRVKNGLSYKLDIEPARHLNRKQWLYTIVRAMMLEGNGNQVTLPRLNADGSIRSLDPLPPSQVSLVPHDWDSYLIRYGGEEFHPDEVLHFVLNPDPESPWLGTGFSNALRDVVRSLAQASKTKTGLMEAPTPNFIVRVNGLIEEMQDSEGRAKLQEQYLGDMGAGKPFIIPSEAFDVTSITPLTLNDLAIKDNIELDKRTVAGIFGMPAFLLGVGQFNKDEYNNFITSCLMPFAKIIEQELTRKLLYAQDLFFKFNYRSLYAYDLPEIITAGAAMVDRMAMDRNEWRDWVGIGPDDRMNDLLALENYLPAEMLGKQKKLVVWGEEGYDADDA